MKKVFTIYESIYVFNHEEQEGLNHLKYVNEYESEEEAVGVITTLIECSDSEKEFVILPTYKKNNI